MSVPRYLLALLLAATGVAQAVEFDENVKAPRAVSGADLKSRLDAVSVRVSGPGAMDALERVRNTALARQHLEARWMVGQMVDARLPLTELEADGFEKQPDGSYVIDGAKHPEWHSMLEKVLVLSDATVLTRLEPAFTARGFRPEDHAALTAYVESHDLARMRGEAQLQLMISASKKAKKLHKLKRLDDNFMESLFYQKQVQSAGVEMSWATGLLDVLQPQAQRILVSYFSELTPTSVISPTDNASAYRYERELLLRPDFEQFARTAFKEGKL
jgi:hypothetical protein